MNGYDCDTVRDLLPQLARGGIEEPDEMRVHAHLAVCTDCRDEAELVRLIQSTLDPLPDGLETRVLAAVRAGATEPDIATGPIPIATRRAAIRWQPARAVLAAAIAVVAIGGVVVMERAGMWTAGTSAGFDLDAPAMSILSWADVGDGMLHGGTALDELTVEELEQLLEELDS